MNLLSYAICLVAGGAGLALWILTGEPPDGGASPINLGGVAGDGDTPRINLGGGSDINLGEVAPPAGPRRLALGLGTLGLTGALFTVMGVGTLLALSLASAWALVASASLPRMRDVRANGRERLSPRPQGRAGVRRQPVGEIRRLERTGPSNP